ncbi:MAG TPA: hypothetical protein VFW07_02360 [Parafilimonas sp.]|nr:hypothetical protein [Parafilimonas sp.]
MYKFRFQVHLLLSGIEETYDQKSKPELSGRKEGLNAEFRQT